MIIKTEGSSHGGDMDPAPVVMNAEGDGRDGCLIE